MNVSLIWQNRAQRLYEILGSRSVDPRTLRILMSYEYKYLMLRGRRGDMDAAKVLRRRLRDLRCFGLYYGILGRRMHTMEEISRKLNIPKASVALYLREAEEYFRRILVGRRDLS